jgi:predicted regulator of amino acid metabolism with ACT domain
MNLKIRRKLCVLCADIETAMMELAVRFGLARKALN